MTKKFGEHKYDKFIGITSLTPGKKYTIQSTQSFNWIFHFASVKEAREQIGVNASGYVLANAIGKAPKTQQGVQKPKAVAAKKAVAAPVAKAVWPFPAMSPASPTVIDGIDFHHGIGIRIEKTGPRQFRIIQE